MSYEIDCDKVCPKCGNEFYHYRDCDKCENGYCDSYNDDAINNPIEGENVYKCSECNGKGFIEWCPKCRYEFNNQLNGIEKILEELIKADNELLKLGTENISDFARYDDIHFKIDKAVKYLVKWLKTKQLTKQ